MGRPESSPTDEQLLLDNARWLRRLALHMVREPEAANDLFQETMEAALGRPRPPDFPLRAWLFGIMRNLRRLTLRGEKRRHRHEIEDAYQKVAMASPASGSPEVEVEVEVS